MSPEPIWTHGPPRRRELPLDGLHPLARRDARAQIQRVCRPLGVLSSAGTTGPPKPIVHGQDGMFVVLSEGAGLEDDLVAQIKRRLREDCSPRHIPDEIRLVPAVPRTLSGQLVVVPVKRILLGVDPDQVVSCESLANPHALDHFAGLAAEVDRGDPNA